LHELADEIVEEAVVCPAGGHRGAEARKKRARSF
jgi:hypothetical protein